MFLAELDPIQIAIIVIAMGAGFVQWLWGLIKQNLEDKNRRNDTPLSPEERAAREEAWRKQVEQSKQAQGRAQRPSPQAPTPAHDPWSTVRDVFEQFKEEARKAQQPDGPPPLPQQQREQERPAPARRPHRATVRAELHPVPVPPPLPADAFPSGSVRSSPASVTPPVFFATPPPPRLLRPSLHEAGPDFRGLREKLHNPASLKQAVLFREILGPPKALQSAADSPF